jgi:predicted nucleic acid-binding protein
VIVVDTNVITAAFLRSEDRRRARVVLEEDREWRVPPLWRSEFLSACRHGIRVAGMKPARCAEAFNTALALFGPGEVQPDPYRVLAAVGRIPALSSYDAEFLALAQQLDCRVVTQDLDFIRYAARIEPGRVISLLEANPRE